MGSRLQEDDRGSDSEDAETAEGELEGSESEGDGGGLPGFRQVRPAAQDYATLQERRGTLEASLSENEERHNTPSPSSELPISLMTIQDEVHEEGVDGDKVGHLDDAHSKGTTGFDGGESDGLRDDFKKPSFAVRNLVASSLENERRQNAKHHNKRGTTKVGRAKGHKGKMNLRVKADSSGVWD
jgi:hypothetical protein